MCVLLLVVVLVCVVLVSAQRVRVAGCVMALLVVLLVRVVPVYAQCLCVALCVCCCVRIGAVDGAVGLSGAGLCMVCVYCSVLVAVGSTVGLNGAGLCTVRSRGTYAPLTRYSRVPPRACAHAHVLAGG